MKTSEVEAVGPRSRAEDARLKEVAEGVPSMMTARSIGTTEMGRHPRGSQAKEELSQERIHLP